MTTKYTVVFSNLDASIASKSQQEIPDPEINRRIAQLAELKQELEGLGCKVKISATVTVKLRNPINWYAIPDEFRYFVAKSCPTCGVFAVWRRLKETKYGGAVTVDELRCFNGHVWTVEEVHD